MRLLLASLFLLGSLTSFACTEFNNKLRAHKTVWSSLYKTNQINTSFKNSGKAFINSLPFMINQEDLKSYAKQFEEILKEGRGAKRVGNKSVFEIISDSKQKNSTLCELATEIGKNFIFHGEDKILGSQKLPSSTVCYLPGGTKYPVLKVTQDGHYKKVTFLKMQTSFSDIPHLSLSYDNDGVHKGYQDQILNKVDGKIISLLNIEYDMKSNPLRAEYTVNGEFTLKLDCSFEGQNIKHLITCGAKNSDDVADADFTDAAADIAGHLEYEQAVLESKELQKEYDSILNQLEATLEKDLTAKQLIAISDKADIWQDKYWHQLSKNQHIILNETQKKLGDYAKRQWMNSLNY